MKQKYLVSLFCTAAAFLTLASSASAATIVYHFTGNSAAATTNSFDGVTAGDIETVANSGQAGVAEERWQRKLSGGTTDSMSFTVTIPAEVIVDLTELSFIDGIDSGQGTNDTFSRWILSISTGSASPDSGTRSLTTGATGVTSGNNIVTLSGLNGLTDTSVTFTWAVDYATNTTYSAGNNNERHAFLDNVTLTGSVIPEPSTALLGSLGLLALLRRRR